jgi:hypothetical protein
VLRVNSLGTISTPGFCVMGPVVQKAAMDYYQKKWKCYVVGSTSCTRMYPEVSGLAAWSQNCKWYSSLPLRAVVSLFYESV